VGKVKGKESHQAAKEPFKKKEGDPREKVSLQLRKRGRSSVEQRKSFFENGQNRLASQEIGQRRRFIEEVGEG